MTEDKELRQRVRDAWFAIRKSHKLRRYDDCLCQSAARSVFILHVAHSPWTETEILDCFMAMARDGELHKTVIPADLKGA